MNIKKSLLKNSKTKIASLIVLSMLISYGVLGINTKVQAKTFTNTAASITAASTKKYLSETISSGKVVTKTVIEKSYNSSIQESSEDVVNVYDINDIRNVLTNAIINGDTSIKISYDGDDKLPGYPDILADIITEIQSTEGNDYEKQLLNRFSCDLSYYEGSNQFTASYTLGYIETSEQSSQVKSKVDEILSQIITPDMTDVQKERAINDYICKNVAYDTTLTIHSAYSALFGNGKTVCSGYALLAYRMLTEAGLQARIITGEGDGQPHAWNLVKIDGNWYHLDVTWNDPIPDRVGRVTDTYFNLDDEQMKAENHEWIESDYPACDKVYTPTDNTVVHPTSVAISKMSDALIVGGTDTLTAAVAPSNASNKKVTWKSSNASIVKVDDYGNITAIWPGEADITVTSEDGNKAASCHVSVTADNSINKGKFTDYQTVDKGKIWTLVFTSDVGFDDETKQGITVTDSQGKLANVAIQLKDNKTVIVTAPEGGYIPGERYILNIGTKAHSKTGVALRNSYKLHFNIAE
ncbi:Ig-like domain-containing protein [Clostridium sp. JS66]|uniref:Ig-like domain-containing protein n=1 Tax=Clostridium sp. JS66 TaxID=3064705 RepID=UPI00298E4E72|nr:Ig-like domain-containing protein [Clostridium sp. JS66]WPC41224.1 Ig-like domain-containing protein [Clostridium sp. JS66]